MAILGLVDGDTVLLSSRTSQITASARAADDIPPGVVSMAHCWGAGETEDSHACTSGSSTSRLVESSIGLDRFVGMARQSAIPIAVERASPQPVAQDVLHDFPDVTAR
jgi:anaerobic selenocysteine-containing dehydrogenase